jgi:threonine dehydratase
LDILEEIGKAERRIREHIRTTPLEFSPGLSELSGGTIFLKLENMQLTGSFKVRGALNKLLSLTDEERERGIVTASSGNHGVAMAYLLERFRFKGRIYLPETVSPAKLTALRDYGPEIIFHGQDCVEAEIAARTAAVNENRVFISPYNDPQVVGGQGTTAIELARQCPEMDMVLVPVGGGGLMSGVAAYLKAGFHDIALIGCQPENSPVMYESIKADRIVEWPSIPTLSDGSAGGMEPGSITFEICRRYVDEYSLLSETEIARAVVYMLEKHYLLVEGAAALPVAALLQNPGRYKGQTVVAVVSGSRISLETLKKVISNQ